MRKQAKGFLLGFIVACLLVIPMTAFADNIQAYFNTVHITVDGKNAVKAGENYQLTDGNSVPFSINYKGTTYLPIRKMGEMLGMTIDYDVASKTVQVLTTGGAVKPEVIPPATTDSAVKTSESYMVFNECNKNTNNAGTKVISLLGYKNGSRLDATADYSYYSDVSGKSKSAQLWKATEDSKGYITKLTAVSASKTGQATGVDGRKAVTLSGKTYNLENNVVVYQWNEDYEYKLYSGNLRVNDSVAVYDTDNNGKYDVVIFSRGDDTKLDVEEEKDADKVTEKPQDKPKPTKSTTGYSVLNEVSKDANDANEKVQRVSGYNDGSRLEAQTTTNTTVSGWGEPSADGTWQLYELGLSSDGIIVSADKVSADVSKGTVDDIDGRKSVTIGGKQYSLSDKVVIYQVDGDEYRLYGGSLKKGDTAQLYDVGGASGYDVVIYSRP